MSRAGRDEDCSRRRWLLALASSTLAGCVGREERPPALGELVLRNSHEQSVEVRVSVSMNGEARYRETHELDAFDGRVYDEVVIVEPWMGEQGARYEVHVEVPDVGSSTYSTDAFTRMFDSWDGAPCFALSADVAADNVGFYVGVDEECPEETQVDRDEA